jgi:hypothetical protein
MLVAILVLSLKYFWGMRCVACTIGSKKHWCYPVSSGLYYKHTTIVNYASSVINKLEALLTDDARGIIYDCHVFVIQATALAECMALKYLNITEQPSASNPK